MYGVDFVNKDTGFICGMYNKLFKTTDGGIHWARENTPPNNHTFLSIRFVNDTVGWTCSTSGQILYTTTGGQTLTGSANQTESISENYELQQNYPNPFNASTKIEFAIKENGAVQLVVFDILGRKVNSLIDSYKTAGKYETTFDASNLSSGIYFYRLSFKGEVIDNKKLFLIK